MNSDVKNMGGEMSPDQIDLICRGYMPGSENPGSHSNTVSVF